MADEYDEIEGLIRGTQPVVTQQATPVSQTNAPKKTGSMADFDINKTYGTPSKLLDNLSAKESTHNQLAINPKTKALGQYQFMPETVAQMHKQGATFNPFVGKESRAAADYTIQQYLKANGGDYKKAMAQYGGFKKEDPTSYVNDVLRDVEFNQQPQAQQAQVQAQPQVQPQAQQQPQDEFSEVSDLISGKPAVTQAPVAPVAQDQNLQPYKMVLNNINVGKGDVAPPQQPVVVPDYQKAINAVNTTNKSNIEQNYINPAVETVATLGSMGTIGMARGVINMLTPRTKEYIDEERKAWKAQNPDLSYNHFEQALIKGISDGTFQPKTKGGQEAVSAISDVLSTLPPTMPHELTSANIRPGLATKMALGGKVAEEVEPGIQSIIEPATEKLAQVESLDTPTYLRQKFAEKQGNVQPEVAPVETNPVAQPKVEIKSTEAENSAPSNIAQPHNPEAEYQSHEYVEKTLPADEVQARMELAHRTAPGLKSDTNVFEGRGKDRSTDYEIAKTDTPQGHLMAEQLAKEKQAQVDYGNKLIDETGGTRGLDETKLYRRGETIVKPLEDLSEEFDNQIKELYKKRDEESANIPVIGNKISDILKTESEVQGHEATVNLASGANARLRELGMMDKDGNMLPSTAKQAEQFRQYLNRKWTPQNASLNGMLKNAVDHDVFENAGEVIYKDARALVEARKNTLDNPQGIAKILDSSGPKGMNRKVAVEKIADEISKMSVDQFDHIIQTLDSVPPALQKSAQQAKSEIKAHFLNKAEEQFSKGANTGTKYLNSNKEVFSRLFTENELSKINDRNSMAHLYKTDTGYKGAAVQKQQLERGLAGQLVEQLAKKGLALGAETITGGTTGGLAAVGTHHAVGSFFEGTHKAKSEKVQVKLAKQKEAGFTSLGDVMKSKPKKNAVSFKSSNQIGK